MASYAPLPTTPPGKSCAVKIDDFGALVVPSAPRANKTRPDSTPPSSNHQVQSGRVTKPQSILKRPNSSKKANVSVHFKDLPNMPNGMEQFRTPPKHSPPPPPPKFTFEDAPSMPELMAEFTPEAPYKCKRVKCNKCARQLQKQIPELVTRPDTSLSNALASGHLVRGSEKTFLASSAALMEEHE